MNFFQETHAEILKLLLEKKVEFILVGGYSVVFHGYNRTTGDLDIWVKPTNENRDRLLEVLREYGIEEADLVEIAKLDFAKEQVFSLGAPPDRIDFLTTISGVEFDTANADKIETVIDNMIVPFIHINHLILSKISSSRSQDKSDVEKLQQIRSRRTNKE